MADKTFTQSCGNCKHGYLSSDYEPCRSCGNDCRNWEASEMLFVNAVANDEEKENKYTYFVFYRWFDGMGHFGIANYGIATDEKIKTMADVHAIETYIKGEFGYERVVVENWKELEGSEE